MQYDFKRIKHLKEGKLQKVMTKDCLLDSGARKLNAEDKEEFVPMRIKRLVAVTWYD